MPNTRIYDDVSGLVVNGINVGGAMQIGVVEDYVDKIDSREDAVQGVSMASNAGQRIDVEITTRDVLQLVPLLTSTPGALTCKAKESGAATYGLLEIAKATHGVLVMHGGSFRCDRRGYAAITVRGTVRCADGTKIFSQNHTFTKAQAAPTITQPNRLWQPTGATHVGLTLQHVTDFSFDVNGRLLVDYGDTDVGLTAVDVADFDLITGTINSRDFGVASNVDIATQLLAAGTQNMTVNLSGVGDSVAKVLSLRNVLFRTNNRSGGKDYSQSGLAFAAYWRDPTNPFTVRNLTDATPANRMINFA